MRSLLESERVYDVPTRYREVVLTVSKHGFIRVTRVPGTFDTS